MSHAMPKPDGISSVILFWNKPALTLRSVRSVAHATDAATTASSVRAADTARTSNPLLLIDNGSTPTNRDLLEKTLREHAIACEFVTLPKNSGFAAGMNAGLRVAFARGAGLVAAISNDVEVAPDFFELLANVDASRAAVYCPRVHHLLDRAKIAYAYGSVDLETLELKHHAAEAGDPATADAKRIVFPRYCPAAATIWTHTAFERLGGFNEEFFCYWEDVELSYRARSAGVDLVPLARARAFHLGRGTTGGKPAMTASFFEGRERFRKILNGEKLWGTL